MILNRILRGLGLLAISLLFAPVQAHANLYLSDPAANAVLPTSPEEIRLWFTENLEPDFSHVFLQDAQGNRLALPDSTIDSLNTHLMILPVDQPLPDGVYTVVWRVLSAEDTHPTSSNFVFTVGDAALTSSAAVILTEQIPAESSIVRWLNLLSMSLLAGTLSFYLFVSDQPRLNRLMWLGWFSVGITSILLLLLQIAVATDSPFLTGLDGQIISQVLTSTRFGEIWLLRVGLWVAAGVCLFAVRFNRLFYWGALLLSVGILITNSLLSHASGAYDQLPSVAGDALHLMATAAWVGGLIALMFVKISGEIAARFSNFARVAVAALIVTGIYAGWLQVGSPEALLTTLYGQVLLLKLVLFIPVLAIAAANLFVTQRQLNAGNVIWNSRLKKLVIVETVLTVGVLALVGIMTSISPSRNTLAARANLPVPPEPQPIIEIGSTEDLRTHFEITPGWVGQNTFMLHLTDEMGNPVENASRVRLRFESQTQRLGESTLQLEHQGEGLYQAVGANLSVPGEWRIRANIQRPEKFDAVLDYFPQVTAAPPPTMPQPVADNSAVLPERTFMLAGIGIVALLVAIVPLFTDRGLSNVIAVGLMFVGGAFLASATTTPTANHMALPPRPTDLTIENLWMLPDGANYNVYFKIFNPTSRSETLVDVEVEGAGGAVLSMETVAIPASTSAYFAPGNAYLTLENVSSPENVWMTFVFESGRELRVPLVNQ